jgi:hypothetical protein
MYLTYKEHVEKWDMIYSLFSKEALLKGEFDRFAEESRGNRGTAPVDKEFLKEIEGWRIELARNIALRNPNLNVRKLNYTVQKTIGRIIFLRMCEDLSVEKYGELLNAAEKENVYEALLELYQRTDEKYNYNCYQLRGNRKVQDNP